VELQRGARAGVKGRRPLPAAAGERSMAPSPALGALVESVRLANEGAGVSQSLQPTIERDAVASGVFERASELGERAARSSLRQQVARLEREMSAIVADGFPHIGAACTAPAAAGPSLLSLEQLEQLRDQLAGRVQDLRRRTQERAEHELRARELLERMKLEPGRYKFVRLPVTDLGQRGCGVWEVRPRFGLIGMLAGWWQVKLSSGCPLARGSRSRRGPAQ
jgi:hypothetical protein